jgi:hypothetical protein
VPLPGRGLWGVWSQGDEVLMSLLQRRDTLNFYSYIFNWKTVLAGIFLRRSPKGCRMIGQR